MDLNSEEFAREWVEAWNAHDLDRILSHYREDVVFTSPFVRTLTGREDGTLHGLAELREYFGRGLASFPDLHFSPAVAAQGIGSVALIYTSVGSRQAVEVMQLDEQGRIYRVFCHYHPG